MTEEKKKNLDFGWRQNLQKVLLINDKSILIDESAHLMQSAISEMSNKFYYAERCMQCGICTGSCPYSGIDGIDFSPRVFIQKSRLGLLDFASEDLWYCTGCGNCEAKCPFDIKLTDVVNGLRSVIYEQGAGFIPESVRNVSVSMVTYKNPWKEDQSKRYSWVKKTKPEQSSASPEKFILFGCCFNTYDSHGLTALKNTSMLLNMAGIECEYLYDSEVCCGDTALRSGNETGFDILKNDNVKAINSTGLKNIIAISPHCYDTINRRYYSREEGYTVQPSILMLHRIIKDGLVKIKSRHKKRITFHDPCFLCRHNNIFKEPRDILNEICDDFVEMKHHGTDSICCGGGGCGVWIDRKKGERFGDLRLAEALKADAEIIVTACPLCMNMLEGSISSDATFRNIEIRDISELILEALN